MTKAFSQLLFASLVPCLALVAEEIPKAKKNLSPADLAELEGVAASGDARAMFVLGVTYAEGRGVPKDVPKAVALFERAAAKGDALAQFNLGAMYANGIYFEKDEPKAVQ